MPRGHTRFERQHLRSLGQRLRELRLARAWSLRQLSTESRVSVAAIQKIEAGEANPSLLTVMALVEVLGEPVDRLISASRRAHHRTNVTRGVLSMSSPGVFPLTGALEQPVLECQSISLAARQRLGREQLPVADALFGYVLDGALQLSFERGRTELVATGDCFHVASERPASLSNPLSRRSHILCVVDRRKHDHLVR